jgi:predicted DNA-binding antitoxin AbrB/MazE fold protein
MALRQSMSTALKVVWEDGVFKPKEPVQFEEHAELEVLVLRRPRRDADDPTGWKAVDRLIGIVKNAPPDLSEHHDVYLHGKTAR